MPEGHSEWTPALPHSLGTLDSFSAPVSSIKTRLYFEPRERGWSFLGAVWSSVSPLKESWNSQFILSKTQLCHLLAVPLWASYQAHGAWAGGSPS